MNILETNDAAIWASEFKKMFPDSNIDEGTMLAWFASAMCAQQDADNRPRKLSHQDCLGIAARVWCDWDFSSHVMDIDACKRIAEIIQEVNNNQQIGGKTKNCNADLDFNLGLFQQCRRMAEAACYALGLKFDETSPSELATAIERLKANTDESPELDSDSWAKHNGKRIPLLPKTKVKICQRNGREKTGVVSDFMQQWMWYGDTNITSRQTDIIAYQVMADENNPNANDPPKTKPEVDSDDWTMYRGGWEQPVFDDVTVKARTKRGRVITCRADQINWYNVERYKVINQGE